MQTDGSRPSFSGVLEETFNAEEDIYALPGSDVNLTCQTQKKGFLVQLQLSKVTDKLDLIALYHPQRGFYCASGSPCESLVAFREAPRNVSKWTLHLRNMSSLLTGKYECSFTLYPEGIQTKIYNLQIQTNGKHVWEGEGSTCIRSPLICSTSMCSEPAMCQNTCKIAPVISGKDYSDFVREYNRSQENWLWESNTWAEVWRLVDINTIWEVEGLWVIQRQGTADMKGYVVFEDIGRCQWDFGTELRDEVGDTVRTRSCWTLSAMFEVWIFI